MLLGNPGDCHKHSPEEANGCVISLWSQPCCVSCWYKAVPSKVNIYTGGGA